MSDLDDAVDRLEDRGQLREAVEAQRAVICAHEAVTPPDDRGNDYERLGGLLVDCYDMESAQTGYVRGPTRLLGQADEAYRVAHAWYVEGAGPSSVDALDALSSRLEVAAARGRMRDVFEHADALALAVSSFDGPPDARNQAADAVRRATECALGASLRPVVTKLARAESELSGQAVASHDVETSTGPPVFEFEDPPRRTTARAAVGDTPFFERYWIVNRGGPCDGIEVTLHGPAVQQGMLRRPMVRVTPRGAKQTVHRGKAVGDGLVVRASVSPGPAVTNEDVLREVGSFGSELDDAVGASRLTIEVEAEAIERGKGDLHISIAPLSYRERGVADSLRLTVVRPRKAPAAAAAPRPTPVSSSTPVRRKGTSHIQRVAPGASESLLHSLTTLFEHAERDPDVNIELRRRLASLPESTRVVLRGILRRETLAPEVLADVSGIEVETVEAALAELRLLRLHRIT